MRLVYSVCGAPDPAHWRGAVCYSYNSWTETGPAQSLKNIYFYSRILKYSLFSGSPRRRGFPINSMKNAHGPPNDGRVRVHLCLGALLIWPGVASKALPTQLFGARRRCTKRRFHYQAKINATSLTVSAASQILFVREQVSSRRACMVIFTCAVPCVRIAQTTARPVYHENLHAHPRGGVIA